MGLGLGVDFFRGRPGRRVFLLTFWGAHVLVLLQFSCLACCHSAPGDVGLRECAHRWVERHPIVPARQPASLLLLFLWFDSLSFAVRLLSIP